MSAQLAPDFTVTHIAGRQVSLSDYRGQPIVLTFSGRQSQQQAQQVEQRVRANYGPDEVVIIGIADLHATPKLLRGVAEAVIKNAYKKASDGMAAELRAQGKPVPEDLSHWIVLAPDWDGTVVSAYGVTGADKQATAVVIDRAGHVRGQASGPQIADDAYALLEQSLS